MASTSSPSIQKSFKYDVFLSFRGEDTRKNFVDHLYAALKQRGIVTYKDDENIEKGKRINEQLIKSIEDSRFYVIVFSKNYASSSWCLDELAKIMECQEMIEHTAYPIFYDVQPTEIRKQIGVVKDAFTENEKKEAAGKWRKAMEEAAGLAGLVLEDMLDGHEAKFIQKFVHDISRDLHSVDFILDEELVGMGTRIRDVVSSLEIDVDDVRMLGIWGMGGAGKTTLAKAVFDQISFQFEGQSFVENVREESKPSLSGLKTLQNQVLSDILNAQGVTVSGVLDGKNKMKKAMRGRKVLVVLDDVNHKDQVEALAGNCNWFKPGSRIIITTRDKQVLAALGVGLIHNVTLLSEAEAGCLFSRHAFGRENPIKGYEELSRKVLQYADGLPLTIKVMGSHLRDLDESEWKNAIKRLEKIPCKDTMEVLELSFDGLDNDHKEIFLDVACILKGWGKETAIRVLESCEYYARYGLRVLEQKSLITYDKYGRLGMHDHLEEMGMNIVRRLYPDEPNKHSRLWIDEEIEDVLTNDLGTQATKCLYFWSPGFNAEIAVKGLAKMNDLRFIHIDLEEDYSNSNIVEFDKVSEYLPSSLRFMRWIGFPFSSLPNTFQGKYLVELDIEYSSIVQLWEDGKKKVLNNLRFLRIVNSKLRTFDLRLAPNLEQLTINGCYDFVELHIPTGNTPNLETLMLEYLTLNHSKLTTLDLGRTPNLKLLILKNCYDLVEINAPVGNLKNLLFLDLSGCGRFKSFVFDKCSQSTKDGSLSELHLIAEPTDVCPLHSENDSPKFQLSCYYKEDPDSSFGNLEKLISLGLCACTNLESFPRSICSLQSIRKLTLEGSITEAPRDLDQLECLEELTFSSTEIKNLPDSICKLKHLKSLELKTCFLLQKLPDDLGQIESLETLIITDCNRLRDIPNNMGKIKCVISPKVYKRYSHGRYKQKR